LCVFYCSLSDVELKHDINTLGLFKLSDGQRPEVFEYLGEWQEREKRNGNAMQNAQTRSKILIFTNDLWDIFQELARKSCE
jgi:hypothetical protein